MHEIQPYFHDFGTVYQNQPQSFWARFINDPDQEQEFTIDGYLVGGDPGLAMNFPQGLPQYSGIGQQADFAVNLTPGNTTPGDYHCYYWITGNGSPVASLEMTVTVRQYGFPTDPSTWDVGTVYRDAGTITQGVQVTNHSVEAIVIQGVTIPESLAGGLSASSVFPIRVESESYGTVNLTLNPYWLQPGSYSGVCEFYRNEGPAGQVAVTVTVLKPSDRYVSPQGGIESAEAFGSLRLVQQIYPQGIPTAAAYGTPKASRVVKPQGIASAATFGQAELCRAAHPSGIASEEAAGSPLIYIFQPPRVPTLYRPQHRQSTGASASAAAGSWSGGAYVAAATASATPPPTPDTSGHPSGSSDGQGQPLTLAKRRVMERRF